MLIPQHSRPLWPEPCDVSSKRSRNDNRCLILESILPSSNDAMELPSSEWTSSV